MDSIYCDVGRIAQIIEEKLTKKRFEPLGDAAINWASSRAIDSPALWLCRWFARAYTKGADKRTVIGFCIHLGNYESVVDLAGLPSFPFVSVSVLDGLSEPASTRQRTNIYEALWRAGWFEDDVEEDGGIIRGKITSVPVHASSKTFFIDLLELDSPGAIQSKVVDRLVAIHEDRLGRG